jgi:lipopolysaccharide export system permease protein
VVLFEDAPHRLVQNKITAKKAAYESDGWRFYDTIRYQMDRRGDLEAEPVFSESLRLNLEATPEDFIKESSQVETMNTRQLEEHIRHLENASKKLAKQLWVDFHYKIAFPFVSFVVILIGAPLAMRSTRGGVARGAGISVVLVLLYFGIDSICLALGKGGHLPAFFSAWFSNLFFAALGIYLMKSAS